LIKEGIKVRISGHSGLSPWIILSKCNHS